MIEFRNIVKDFGKHRVLDHISLIINDGDLVAVIGESGCGKTTLLKMANLLVKPTSGKILVDGVDITDKSVDIIEMRRSMGYVVQSTGLFPHMTVKQNIELIPKIKNVDKEEVSKRVIEYMNMVGLDTKTYLDRYPTELSGGQQQRIGVARAYAIHPKIILMDEPFSALDPMTRSDLQDELNNIQADFHKTIMFVTHDMDEAIKIADKICIMNKGKILQYDTPENILKNPIDDYVANFVGKNRIWQSPEFIGVKDVMIDNPITTNSKTTIMRGLEKMKKNAVDSLIIVDPNDKTKYVGFAHARNCRKATDRTQPISTVLSENYPTLSDDEKLINALNLINESKNSTIPVVDSNNNLKGIVTRGSLLVAMSTQYIEENIGIDIEDSSDIIEITEEKK
ncbi:MAG: betaine/proline/choline family ABC transporter ATP-binding protein [Clostridia bacterium]